MNTHKTNSFSWFCNIAVIIIVIAFFIISCLGYMRGDDFWMNSDVFNLFDLVKYTGAFYFYSGGRLFSVACQYMFSGVLGNHRIWYAIVNTLFFVVLIVTCGKLIKDRKQGFATVALLFSLLFWFLCPVPKDTLFWIAGSPTYMWANTLSFIFVLLYLKYKDENFGTKEKLGLFVLSFLAASEFITGASISGALAVYYAFNIKKLKGNAVPFVVGFALGSIFLLFAPGNFRRAAWDYEGAALFDIRYLVSHPLQEVVKYKALWLFLAVLIYGWVKNKTVVKEWMKSNAFLLLSLGWSVIAFSVVFRTVKRALFFTETLSIILFLRFLYDNIGMLRIRFVDKFPRCTLHTIRDVVMVLLFAVFVVDSVFAVAETNKQRKNNDIALNQIVDSGGIVALDQMLSSHRMAYAPVFGSQTNKYLAKKLDLDTVCVYPYYCLDKYYHQDFSIENVYIAYDYYADDADMPYNVVVLVIRIESDGIQNKGGQVVFTIDCGSKGTMVFEREAPSYCFEGYGYYPFYFNRDNAENLRSVECEFK
ncbi:MAG: hypothetical protein IKX35_05495 [Bacteroidales bacterium]|nr:hypothetical protein [Bacteroidales bacterium]